MTPDTTRPETTTHHEATRSGTERPEPEAHRSAADAEQAESDTEQAERLRDLITRARFVVFDFDGPICRLFAGHTAAEVARDLVEWLERQGLRGLLTDEERVHADPMAVLYAVNRRHPRSDLVTDLEDRLTQQELKAVPSAWPTAYVDPLIRTWSALGVRLAIATNNSPLTATSYLRSRHVADCFLPNVYGRTRELDHLKPDPHCLNRALNALGAAPASALMIGDTPTDFTAAREAGVPFLGYARDEEKEQALRKAGATDVVGSFQPLLSLLRHRG